MLIITIITFFLIVVIIYKYYIQFGLTQILLSFGFGPILPAKYLAVDKADLHTFICDRRCVYTTCYEAGILCDKEYRFLCLKLYFFMCKM